MKNLLKSSLFVTLCFLVPACGQLVTAAPSPTATATFTPIRSSTPTATVKSTPTQEYVPPTLIPTIDPTLVPDLLRKAFSIRTTEGVNGHKIRQITGWDHGFGAGMYQYSCSGYYWLDKNHLLLYPQAGQRLQALVTDAESPIGIAPQSVVINLNDGAVWLPPVAEESMSKICDRIYWSPELGILINSEVHNDTSTVSTYTYDGHKLASYPGSLTDVSPHGTKILLEDNTLIDLRTNKRITLDWSLKDYQEEMLSDLFWTSDETRIYRCCYFYADLRTGTSYRFEQSDFRDTNGNPLDHRLLWFYRGGWIQNDTYFLVTWSWVDDGDIRYIPMLDPAKKIFLDVREKAGIPSDWSCERSMVSPDGRYIWMSGWGENGEGSYLVDLSTFESQYYPNQKALDVDWSPSSKFALLESQDSLYETKQYYLFSASNKELKDLAIKDVSYFWEVWWHPTDDVFAYISKNDRKIVLFNTKTMNSEVLTTPGTIDNFVWSPNGDRIAIVAEDGSVWQVDYPNLQKLEQLTPPLPDVGGVTWSLDGSSIAFISGSDIYIVETNK